MAPRAAPKPSATEQGKISPDAPKAVNWLTTLRAVWMLGVPFFSDRQSRLKACGLLSLNIAIVIVEVTLTYFLSVDYKHFTNALFDRDEGKFWHTSMHLLVLCMLLPAAFFLGRLVAGALALEWRRHFTHRLFGKYINDKQAYYKLKMEETNIDNPDQRIAQDVNEFTATAVFLITHFTRDLCTVATSSWAIFRMSNRLGLFLIGFSLIHTLIMLKCFAAPLMRVQRRVLALEADLRFILIRLREHAESIAFFRGAHVEKLRSEAKFVTVVRAEYKKLCITAGFHSFSGWVFHTLGFASYFVLAPMYFAGTVSYGDMHQAHSLFYHTLKSTLDFTSHLDKISGLGAQSLRVIELWDALDRYAGEDARDDTERSLCKEQCGDDVNGASADANPDLGADEADSAQREADVELGASEGRCDAKDGGKASKTGSIYVEELASTATESLVVRNLKLLPPHSQVPLLQGLSFSMGWTNSVLLTGPSGAGKSSLLRAIAGFATRGHGSIGRTATQHSFFLPQSPYLYEGSLRENVLYPSSAGKTRSSSDGKSANPEDDEQACSIRNVFESLGIGYLIDRHGLDEEVDFDKMLSGGEKQRLNFARVLLQRDLRFVYLDEATSALDEANEDALYGLLRASVDAFMSVGHRPNLKKFHTHQLCLERASTGGCRGHMIAL